MNLEHGFDCVTKKSAKKFLENLQVKYSHLFYDAGYKDVVVEFSDYDYEWLRIHIKGISFIVYPYKCPSASGHRDKVRVMKGDKIKAYEIMDQLNLPYRHNQFWWKHIKEWK